MKNDSLDEAPEIIKEFLGYIGTVKGRSPKTVEEYFPLYKKETRSGAERLRF